MVPGPTASSFCSTCHFGPLLLLVHSALLACLVRERNPATLMQGRWGLSLHGILGAGFFLYALHLFHPG